jgi:hypothetical protein
MDTKLLDMVVDHLGIESELDLGLDASFLPAEVIGVERPRHVQLLKYGLQVASEEIGRARAAMLLLGDVRAARRVVLNDIESALDLLESLIRNRWIHVGFDERLSIPWFDGDFNDVVFRLYRDLFEFSRIAIRNVRADQIEDLPEITRAGCSSLYVQLLADLYFVFRLEPPDSGGAYTHTLFSRFVDAVAPGQFRPRTLSRHLMTWRQFWADRSQAEMLMEGLRDHFVMVIPDRVRRHIFCLYPEANP